MANTRGFEKPKTPRPEGAPPAMSKQVPGDRKPSSGREPDQLAKAVHQDMHSKPSSVCLLCNREILCDTSGIWYHINDETPMCQPNDQVVRPSHYQAASGGFQVWDIVDQFDLNYYFGDAVKYICRAGKKKRNTARVDIEKAIQYLQRWLDVETRR